MSGAVADLSRRLRDAREAAALSLSEISARTKISVAALRALESGDFDRLPGDFYTRAFLKAYARELRLPADEIVREYDESRMPPAPPPAIPQAAPTRVPVDWRKFVPDSDWQKVVPAINLREPLGSNVWAAASVLVLLVMVAAIVYRQKPVEHREEAQAVATAGAVAAAPAAASTSGQTPTQPPGKLTVDIRPTAPVWVSATADGNSAIYRLLKPGDKVVVEGRKELSFRIGNAAAFVYDINGVPGKPLGGPDEVREFDIRPDNYLTFRR